MDLQYLCKEISHVTGVPVRVYEGDILISFSSVSSLAIDPFDVWKDEVFRIEKHIGYYVTSHDTYYGVVRSGETRIILGPTSQIPLSDQTMHDIAFRIGVKKEGIADFIGGLKRIVPMPLMSVVQYLCLINYIINDGETLSIFDVAIIDREQNKLIRSLTEGSVQRAEEGRDDYPHNTMDMEEYMLGLVRSGNVAELRAFFENAPAIRGGVIAQSDLRQAKNLLVVTATLVSRAVIHGGMDAEEALTLSDSYIREGELLTTIEQITNLNYRMVMEYAERMEHLHYGSPSKLVAEVTNYIFKHLSEPIAVESIAHALCRGRSRLSTDFKKETGENLSDYILKRKTEEAKRVLRYTNRPLVDIALYLGFSSQSHFSRTFKKYTDMTPNEYRNANA